MKGLVYERPGREYAKVCEVLNPVCGEDEVIIKVMSASICKGVEQSHDDSSRTDIDGYPMIPCHEFAGYITEVGKNVHDVKIGDRAAANSSEACGTCYYCKNGQPQYCENAKAYGNGVDGGFAEYAKVHRKCVFTIPDTMSFNEASLLEPICCCLNAVERAEVRYGDTVVVLGAGPMGLIAAQLLNNSHAGQVYLAARASKKTEFAEQLNIKTIHLGKSTGESLIENVYNFSPVGVDVIVDTTGSPALCKDAMKCLKKGGKLVQYGFVHSGEPLVLDPVLMFNNELTFKMSFALPVSYCCAIEAINSGKVNAAALVTGEYKLDDYFIGLDENLKDRNSIKVVIHPNDEGA